jgi:hypothetical protein
MTRKSWLAVLAVYLLLSFMPSLGLTSLLGKAKGGGKKSGGS